MLRTSWRTRGKRGSSATSPPSLAVQSAPHKRFARSTGKFLLADLYAHHAALLVRRLLIHALTVPRRPGVSYASIPVTGLSFHSLSVTAWVRVGSGMDDWVSLWSFGPPSHFRCELSNTGDAQIWSDVNPTARVSRAFDTAQYWLRDSSWHHIAATFDASEARAILFIDGRPVQGTYRGADGVGYAPGAVAPPELFSFGHSPWTQSRAHTELRMSEVKLWAGVLSAAQIAVEFGNFGHNSPPPPPPSPPPPTGDAYLPETATDALGRARLASSALATAASQLGRQSLVGRVPGENALLYPRRGEPGSVQWRLERKLGRELRGATLTLSLDHLSLEPLSVELPQSLQLSFEDTSSFAGAAAPDLNETLLDVLLLFYGDARTRTLRDRVAVPTQSASAVTTQSNARPTDAARA